MPTIWSDSVKTVIDIRPLRPTVHDAVTTHAKSTGVKVIPSATAVVRFPWTRPFTSLRDMFAKKG